MCHNELIKTCVYLICVIWEVNLVKDLRRLVLNRFNFNLMRWILSLSVSQRFLQSLNRIQRDWMPSRSQEKCELLHQGLTADEET